MTEKRKHMSEGRRPADTCCRFSVIILRGLQVLLFVCDFLLLSLALLFHPLYASYIWARLYLGALQYMGARVYIWARHVYSWARHEINARVDRIYRVYLIYRLK